MKPRGNRQEWDFGTRGSLATFLSSFRAVAVAASASRCLLLGVGPSAAWLLGSERSTRSVP